ncbi:MAG TPA: efflux RND transporter periplasmic adaptor subunit [Gemmataceae bacterium]|nr:efflux RND transporter periplasmic adaptor subunit [Gemmataceae bacterium]
MHISVILRRWLLAFGFCAFVAGCEHAPAVVEPPPLEVVVSKPVRKNIEDWDTYTGTVEAKESVEIRARVRGEIKVVGFKEGDEIKEGAKLFTIDSDPFKADLKQAEGMLAAWQAKLKFAEEKIDIYKPLAEKMTISKEELLQAISDKDEAIANIATTKAKITEAELNISYCNITSPISGKVGQALLTKGNIVNATASNGLLTTVVSVDPMYVYFSVNERAFLTYQKILSENAAKADKKSDKNEKALIPVELARLSDTTFPYKGVIDFRDNRVDPNTGSVKVRARFDNPKGPGDLRDLVAGMFARIRVTIADPYPAILIPDRAVLTDQNLKYVLVVNKANKNTVERLDVTASNRIQPGGMVPILSGLKGDEWIIIDGVNRARPGVIVNPKEPPPPGAPADTKKSAK